jgi:hypothetical protein
VARDWSAWSGRPRSSLDINLKENTMHAIHPSPLLKLALVADAIVSGAVALLQVLLPDFLGGLTGLPHALLQYTGLFLVCYTLLLIVLARAPALPRALVLFIVAGNVAWAIGCAELLLTASVTPSALGTAFVLVQAVTGLAFAAMQWAGMRASSPALGRTSAA